jgi:hypothetical protein
MLMLMILNGRCGDDLLLFASGSSAELKCTYRPAGDCKKITDRPRGDG